MAIQRFRMEVQQEILDDLKQRLARTRWIDDLGDPGWKYGLSVPYMRELVAHWHDHFDWREHEAVLNRLHHFRVSLAGDPGIHFVHERGDGPAPMPIVLTHGFPDSFLRFGRLIPMLTHPSRHGGDPVDAFDVVAPSLPGYGFSDAPRSEGTLFRVGDLWHELMTRHLGYARYAAHGGDWGSTISEFLGRDHATEVLGIHLTDVPFLHSFNRATRPQPCREEIPRGHRAVSADAGRVRAHPGLTAASGRPRSRRFAGRSCRMDRGEVATLE